MTGRLLAAGLHGHRALQCGDRIDTGTLVVTADLIRRFADLTGDRYAIHLSDRAAQAAGFAAQVAHGLLILSLTEGLKAQAPAQIDGQLARGWRMTFRQPVLAGQVLRAVFTVETKRAALVKLRVAVLADDAVAQTGHCLLVVNPGD